MTLHVAILGATGVVGQKAIALLENHPSFQIHELIASEARADVPYGDSVTWREPLLPLPERIRDIKLSKLNHIQSPVVISCLPQDIAQEAEPFLAEQGKIIFSNASSFRMQDNVPLLIPEINSEHLTLLHRQSTRGKIITNPNCSTVFVALALAPLQEIAELSHVSVVTLQSISGAGFPGVASLDILGNTIPHISGEAEKITQETKRILGSPTQPALFSLTAHVHRVPVMYGHTVTLHITAKHALSPEQAQTAYQKWNQKHPGLFVLHSAAGHPQAIKDLRHDDQRVHIGHLRQGDHPNVLGLVALGHNLVRGAAGAVLANMEAYFQAEGKSYE